MKAEIIINRNYRIGEIDRRIYGSFIEHLGRAVYGGIYEPGHPTADDRGFRGDVIGFVKELNVPIVRYPGGNFVSGYNWEDGIGDKSKRPRRIELAWQSVEPNQVGIDEFQEWARRAGSEVMMAVNLGTAGPSEAMNCVEYCNSETDTHYAQMRRKNGFEKPFKIKTWCLGNEMDGDWQMGHKTAEEYGRVAAETAKLMKLVDPEIELVLCGSSSPEMPSYIDWELTALEHAYDYVDYISLHSYYNNKSGNTPEFFARSVGMDRFIKTVASVCDIVRAKKRRSKTVNLSFDEWNVWYNCSNAGWKIGAHIMEDCYTLEDAIVVGCLLMTLQNNCDRVKIACMAQLVNVIAPIMTDDDGSSWVQTTFYPFMFASANGRGTAMKPVVNCGSYRSADFGEVPYIETSVIHNAEKRELVVFAVNRSLDDGAETSVRFENFEDCALVEHVELYSDDLKAVNTKTSSAVLPARREIEAALPSAEHRVKLKKHSWNMLRFAY